MRLCRAGWQPAADWQSAWPRAAHLRLASRPFFQKPIKAELWGRFPTGGGFQPARVRTVKAARRAGVFCEGSFQDGSKLDVKNPDRAHNAPTHLHSALCFQRKSRGCPRICAENCPHRDTDELV